MERSVPQVLHDIVGNVEEIIRSEWRLAKTEIKESAVVRAKDASIFGVGVVLGFYGIGFLLLGAVYGLSMIVGGWRAALVVGAVLALVSIGLMTASAKRLKGRASSDR
jgi:Kef-type K+ transport system membrane component KefB